MSKLRNGITLSVTLSSLEDTGKSDCRYTQEREQSEMAACMVEERDDVLAMWRVKKVIKTLDDAKGCVNVSDISAHVLIFDSNVTVSFFCRNGTSMISLIIPAKGQISKTNKLLTEEYGTASQIKNHVNKLSVMDAIKSCKQKLSLYNKGDITRQCATCQFSFLHEAKSETNCQHHVVLQFLPMVSWSFAERSQQTRERKNR